ncbi:hypothetical protein [Kitasatospora sp. NPDC092286]|uniref:hypothetical protein n=1 Tax=Kitasatospora sp. NPDC092286 TaxID=3364087 RepID=UPI003808E704
MGVLFNYYTAADDRAAAGAIVRDDDEPFGTGYDEFTVKGIDPMVGLLPAESLLTGRPEAQLAADPGRNRLVAMLEDGEIVALTIPDALRDALTAADHHTLTAAGLAWSRSDTSDMLPDEAHLTEFLEQLAALARRAASRGHHLYCWICP